jgi:DNA gyrase subunit A
MRFIPGPDLPTGGRIVGLEGIREAYEGGRGVFRTRATATIESITPRRKGIVVTELPFNIGPEKVITKVKELVQGKKIQGIADLKDLTGREHGLRLVIEIKSGFNPEGILEQLYKLTPLEESFGINNVALVDGQPLTLGLKERGRAPPLGAPPEQARRATTSRRWAADRPAEHRRGDPGDPLVGRHGHGAGAPHGAVLAHRGAGELHPRHSPAPAHQVRPARAGTREAEARRGDRRAHRDPRVGRAAA